MSVNSLKIMGGAEAGEDGMDETPEAERAKDVDSGDNTSRAEEEGVPEAEWLENRDAAMAAVIVVVGGDDKRHLGTSLLFG